MSYDPSYERFLALLTAIILALVSFPIVIALVIWGCVRIGAADMLGMIFSLAGGLAAFVLIVWKAPGAIRKGLDTLRAKSPEPLYSCFAVGLACALTVGVMMSLPILLIGHTRPEGWELDRIPPFVGGAFLLGLTFGIPLGRDRNRQRKSQRNAVVR